ncbi:MAG TPA: hypothetical protein PKN13_05800 [Accumulibacter sp.]|nr:hypothetical protein [Accumulibacter sp.]
MRLLMPWGIATSCRIFFQRFSATGDVIVYFIIGASLPQITAFCPAIGGRIGRNRRSDFSLFETVERMSRLTRGGGCESSTEAISRRL